MKNNLILKYEFYLHIFTDFCKVSGSDNSPNTHHESNLILRHRQKNKSISNGYVKYQEEEDI